MSLPDDVSRSSETHRTLYQRLVARDPTAPSDMAVEFLQPLIGWLSNLYSRLDRDWIEEAVGKAICNLVQRPDTYHPESKSLEAYLRMSAEGDLLNIQRKERQHRLHFSTQESVELSESGGNYLKRNDDPSSRLVSEEECAKLNRDYLQAVRRGLSREEEAALELLLDGVRETGPYAQALKFTHLPKDEQARQVNQFKDRMKKRLERSRSEHDQSS